ncbi:hypothetical protein ACFLU1_04745 [Chloroflexota bacterium]
MAWIAAIILAVMMLRSGGGRAEWILFGGISVMLVNSVIDVLQSPILRWARNSEMNFLSLLGQYYVIRNVLNTAAIISMVYAFWIKFKVTAHD